MKVVCILGVEIDAIRSEEILNKVEEAVQGKRRALFAYANIYALNLAYERRWFRDFLNKADVLYTDGEGVRLGAWLLGSHISERVVLTTWIWKLAQWCEEKGFSVFLLGSSEAVVERAAEKAQERFPRLRIVGAHHGYFQKSGVHSDEVIAKINETKPDVLLVGFGMPLQEKWIQEHIEKIQAHAIFSAGSCFEYMAGVKSVCPQWISNAGFEWLYRLIQEPRRLFVRYIIGNPLFVLRVLRQRLGIDQSVQERYAK